MNAVDRIIDAGGSVLTGVFAALGVVILLAVVVSMAALAVFAAKWCVVLALGA